ncbi:F-box/LRR-repeat protein 4-like [Crassostrea virginica]
MAISKHCPNLEQLDILGTSNVHRESVYSVLTSCRKLIFLDVSFCGNVDEDTINIWRSEFPQCSIKKSFQD